ncbi:hypothetical protein YB2330_004957 [Saitoella coloradoensis]
MSSEVSKKPIDLPARTPSPEPETLFEEALSTIFNDIQLSHGEPGNDFIYHHPQHGDITLRLSSPSWEQISLFAHFVWSSSLLLARLLSENKYPLRGQTVLELGAGTGLVSICAVRDGAGWVTVSDYPSDEIIASLRHNIETQISPERKDKVRVEPHAWGVEPYPLIPESAREAGDEEGRYDWVVACDTLWVTDQHANLISTITSTLSYTPSARLLLVAGFHTGRANVVRFFKLLAEAGFVERGEGKRERMVNRDVEREWAGVRGDFEEDLVERKRWVVIAEMGWSDAKLQEFAST